jgi:hypothetical protein
MSSGRVKKRRPRERFAFDDPKRQFENGFLSGRLSPTNAGATARQGGESCSGFLAIA